MHDLAKCSMVKSGRLITISFNVQRKQIRFSKRLIQKRIKKMATKKTHQLRLPWWVFLLKYKQVFYKVELNKKWNKRYQKRQVVLIELKMLQIPSVIKHHQIIMLKVILAIPKNPSIVQFLHDCLKKIVQVGKNREIIVCLNSLYWVEFGSWRKKFLFWI